MWGQGSMGLSVFQSQRSTYHSSPYVFFYCNRILLLHSFIVTVVTLSNSGTHKFYWTNWPESSHDPLVSASLMLRLHDHTHILTNMVRVWTKVHSCSPNEPSPRSPPVIVPWEHCCQYPSYHPPFTDPIFHRPQWHFSLLKPNSWVVNPFNLYSKVIKNRVSQELWMAFIIGLLFLAFCRYVGFLLFLFPF